ncbi:MAG: response regulator [Candidatus Electryonea clarkiae]|nr:response regulator [Candidatus Electryonea clarkiae]MDP8288414.1 response regulator [Candidatus Electryonea clarkiae]
MIREANSLEGLCLLIVDDDPGVREVLVSGLEMKGAEVIEAFDGQEGWERFQDHSESIDAVISDVHMPNMTGIELLNLTKSIKPGTPFMLITGYSNAYMEQLQTQSTNPPDAYLEKPFRFTQLLSKIKEMIEKNIMESA